MPSETSRCPSHRHLLHHQTTTRILLANLVTFLHISLPDKQLIPYNLSCLDGLFYLNVLQHHPRLVGYSSVPTASPPEVSRGSSVHTTGGAYTDVPRSCNPFGSPTSSPAFAEGGASTDVPRSPNPFGSPASSPASAQSPDRSSSMSALMEEVSEPPTATLVSVLDGRDSVSSYNSNGVSHVGGRASAVSSHVSTERHGAIPKQPMMRHSYQDMSEAGFSDVPLKTLNQCSLENSMYDPTILNRMNMDLDLPKRKKKGSFRLFKSKK